MGYFIFNFFLRYGIGLGFLCTGGNTLIYTSQLPLSSRKVGLKTVLLHIQTHLLLLPLDFTQWQQSACQQLDLQHTAQPRLRHGGPTVPLTRPDMRSVRHMYGDDNCLFWAFSYILTGSEDQHLAVHYAALDHMINNAQYILGHHLTGNNSVQSYSLHRYGQRWHLGD